MSLPYSLKIFCGGDSITSWGKQLLYALLVLSCLFIGNSPVKLDRSELIGSLMWLLLPWRQFLSALEYSFWKTYGSGFKCQVQPLNLTAVWRGCPSDSEPKIFARQTYGMWISANINQDQTSRTVRHLSTCWGACQSCEMHLPGSAMGTAGKVEGQRHLPCKAESNQCAPAKNANYWMHIYRILDSLRSEKTSKIIKPNLHVEGNRSY